MSVSKFIKNNWGKLVLILVWVVIIVANLKIGHYILGNDNFAPELDPDLSLQRALLSPAWRGYRALGLPSNSEQADLFRILLYKFSTIFAPNWIVSQGYIFLSLLIGPYFAGLLTKKIGQNSLKIKNGEAIFLISSFIYLFNLKMLHNFYFTLIIFVAAYAFFPMLLYFTWQYVRKPRLGILLLFCLSVLLLSTAGLTITMFLVMIPVWLLFLMLFLWIENENTHKAKTFFILTITFFILISFWTLPFPSYVLNNAIDVQQSYINRQLTPDMIQSEIDTNSLANVLIYWSNWIDLKFGEQYTFLARDFYNNGSIKIFSFFPLVLAILGIGTLFIKKKWKLLVLVALFLIGVVITTGVNPPLGQIFTWLQENIPLFKQVFRWQSTKFWLLTLLPVTILGGIGVGALLDFFTSSQKRSKVNNLIHLVIISTFALVFLIWGWPLFRGDLIFPRFYVQVPNQYGELKQFIKEMELDDSRIYLTPEANSLYFRNHDWSKDGQRYDSVHGPGFWGSGFLYYYLPNPLIEKSLIIDSQLSEDAFEIIKQTYYAEDEQLFTESLQRYEVKLIMSDKSNTDSLPGYAYDWELEKKMVEKNPYLVKIWQKDFLTLYKVPESAQSGYKSVYSNHNTRKLQQILISQDSYENTISNSLGRIYPLALEFDSLKYNEGNIELKHIYQSDRGIYSPFLIERKSDYSIELSLENSILFLGPLFPRIYINEKPFLSSQRYKLEDEYFNYLVIDSDVISREELLTRRVFLEKSISKLDKYKLFSYKYEKVPLMSILGTKKVQNQKGIEIKKGKKIGNSIQVPVDFKQYGISIDKYADKTSVQNLFIDLESSEPIQVTFCAWSQNKKRCLNEHVSFIHQGIKSYSIPIDTLIQKGDRIVYNISWQALVSEKAVFKIRNLYIKEYVDYIEKSINLTNLYLVNASSRRVEQGDEIVVKIPLIRGKNNFSFTNNSSDLLPEFDASECYKYDTSGYVKSDVTGISIKNKNCQVSFFPTMDIHPKSDFNLLFYDVYHNDGVPVMWGFRKYHKSDLFGYNYEQRAAYENKKSGMDLFFLPTTSKVYKWDLTVWGPQKNFSENRIQRLDYINLPQVWSELYLEPMQIREQSNENLVMEEVTEGSNFYQVQVDRPQIVTIPHSYHKGWIIINANEISLEIEKKMIDNWQMGFMLPKSGEYYIFYGPTILAYFSIILVILYILLIILKGIFL